MNFKKTTLSVAVLMAISVMTGCGGGSGSSSSNQEANNDAPVSETSSVSTLTKLKNEVQTDVTVLSVKNGNDGLYELTYNLSFKKPASAKTNSLIGLLDASEETKVNINVNGTEETVALEDLVNNKETICDRETDICSYIGTLKDVTGADESKISKIKVNVNDTEIVNTEIAVNEEAVANSVIPKPKPSFEITCMSNECFLNNTTETDASSAVYIWNIKDGDTESIYNSKDPGITLKGKGTVKLAVVDGYNMDGTYETKEIGFDAPANKGYATPKITKYVINFAKNTEDGETPSYQKWKDEHKKIYGAYYENFVKHVHENDKCDDENNWGNSVLCPLSTNEDITKNEDLKNGLEFTPKEMKQKFLDKASIIAIRDDEKIRQAVWYVTACVDESSPWEIDEDGVASLTVNPSAFGNLIVSYAYTNNYSCALAENRLAARFGTTPEKFNYDNDATRAYIQILNEVRWIFENDNPSDAAGYLVHGPSMPSLIQNIWANLSYEDESAIAEIEKALAIESNYDVAYPKIKSYYQQHGNYKDIKNSQNSESSQKAYVNRKMSAKFSDQYGNEQFLYMVQNADQYGKGLKPVVYVCDADADNHNDTSCSEALGFNNIYCGYDGKHEGADGQAVCPNQVINGVGMALHITDNIRTAINNKTNGAKVFLSLQHKPENVEVFSPVENYDIDESYIIVNDPNTRNYLTVSKQFNWWSSPSDQKTLADIYTQKMVKYALASDLSDPTSQLGIYGIPPSNEPLTVEVNDRTEDTFHVYSILDDYNRNTYLRTSCMKGDDSSWVHRGNGSYSTYLKSNTFDFMVSSYAQQKNLSCSEALVEVKKLLSPKGNMENTVFGDKTLAILLSAIGSITWEFSTNDISKVAALPEKYKEAYDDIKEALEAELSVVDIKNYFKHNNYSFKGAKDSQKHAYDNGLISLIGNNSEKECTSWEENGSWKVYCGARIVNNFYSDAELKVGAIIKINGEEIDNRSGLIGVYNDVETPAGNIIVHKVDGRKAYIKSTPKAIGDEAGVIYWGIEMTLKDKPTSYDITLSVEGQGKNSYGREVTQDTSRQITGEF